MEERSDWWAFQSMFNEKRGKTDNAMVVRGWQLHSASCYIQYAIRYRWSRNGREGRPRQRMKSNGNHFKRFTLDPPSLPSEKRRAMHLITILCILLWYSVIAADNFNNLICSDTTPSRKRAFVKIHCSCFSLYHIPTNPTPLKIPIPSTIFTTPPSPISLNPPPKNKTTKRKNDRLLRRPPSLQLVKSTNLRRKNHPPPNSSFINHWFFHWR